MANSDCFFVNIVDDDVLEGTETLQLSLSNPLGDPIEFQPDPNTATILISDNESELKTTQWFSKLIVFFHVVFTAWPSNLVYLVYYHDMKFNIAILLKYDI